MRWLLATLTLQLPSLVASLILHERHLTTRDANHSRVALPAEQKSAARLLPDSRLYSLPLCGCSCCQVTPRLPYEIEKPDVALKCIQKQTYSEVSETKSVDYVDLGCQGATCAYLDPKMAEVPENLGQYAVDFNYFCFYHCKPFDYTLGTPCMALTPEELESHAPVQSHVDHNLPPMAAAPEYMLEPKPTVSTPVPPTTPAGIA
mmetsp:Transcript_10829/g.24530  ORF Transcript_10829/g.24530 Transcript_10829/m.24530 type:complete len:204 (+) Transcript_10829:97-708(+)